MMPTLTKLFEPITIGSLRLKNRIVMPPITTLYDYEGGPRHTAFFAERARGGAAMIVINLQALYPGRAGKSGWVPDESVLERGALTINHDLYVPRLRVLTQALHEHGCMAAVQLAVYGFWARGGYGAPAEELSPSGVRLEGPQYRPGLERLSFVREGRPATIDELHEIQEEVASAAVRAVKAGFDAVQLQALGGNFISRFLSPVTNRRTDEYGGPLRNRARMLVETVAAIKRAIGPTFPLLCRINGDDLIPGGMGPADYQQLVPMIEDAGVHAIDLMPGWYETRQPVNQMCVPRGAFVYAAEAMKKVARVPVSANIRITDPLLAERILADGRADLISICTPLVADPEWPNKAREGRLDDIRRCTGCCNCWSDLAGSRKPIGCSVNARAGMETTYTVTPAAPSRNVWIIGGGPGGMEAARVAAERGHRVTLVERHSELGGQLLYAEIPPHKGEWRVFTTYLTTQLKKLNVTVKLGVEATAAGIVAARPDVVILATGARPARLVMPGADLPHVVSFLDVLTGKVEAGARVVVIGGGCNGSETAEFLHSQGRHVTLVELRAEMALDIDFWNRWVLLDRLVESGMRMIVNARPEAITADGVRIVVDGRVEVIPADTVVYAVGSRPYNPLQQALEGQGPEVFVVADCDEAQRVRQAVDAGFRCAMAL
ncbi:MAG: FAD-dependent oxidoreductase [Acidobacteria bacterium]|nr:FAD-dependent oxidoreductase [Acidobacteriota bacterium]